MASVLIDATSEVSRLESFVLSARSGSSLTLPQRGPELQALLVTFLSDFRAKSADLNISLLQVLLLLNSIFDPLVGLIPEA